MILLIAPSHLARARRLQESLMTATCTIRRPAPPIYDPALDDELHQIGILIYEGPIRIQSDNARTLRVTIPGQQPVETSTMVCAVPWHVTGIRPGDTIHLSDFPDPADPSLTGATLTVVEVEANTVAITARRFTAALNHPRPQ